MQKLKIKSVQSSYLRVGHRQFPLHSFFGLVCSRVEKVASPTRALSTFQLLLTNFTWVPMCIKKTRKQRVQPFLHI